MKPRLSLSFWPLACVFVSCVVAVPTLAVVVMALGGSPEWPHIVETRLGEYVRNTLLLGAGVAFVATVLGVATAWVVTTCEFPLRGVMRWMLLLPLAVPAYVSAYAYVSLLRFTGPVQTALRDVTGWGRRDYWFPPIDSVGGATVILGLALYPYVYLAARTAFFEHAGAAMEVGRSLGRGPWAAFAGVALPLARPATAAGATLVVMETFADFGVADYCGFDTLATGVYRAWRGYESAGAAAGIGVLLLVAVAALIATERLLRRGARHHAVASRHPTPPRWRLGPLRAAGALAVCLVPVTLGFLVPAGMFLHMALTTGDARAAEVALVFGRNTLTLASLACILAVVLAVVVAYGRRLGRGPVPRAAGRVAGLGYALPGTVIALGLLVPLSWLDHRTNALAGWLFGWTPGLVFTGSVLAVLAGYQARFLGVALAMIEGGLSRIRPGVDDAARSLGAGGWRLLTRVHLPMLRASVLAALLLVFVDVAKELPATLMLRPFNFDTLAVRVHQLAVDERLEEASLGALLIVAVGLVPVIVLSTLLDVYRREPPRVRPADPTA